MSNPVFRWESRIRFVDTDASQRIHYTAMFRHFEAAEMEFLRSLNSPYTGPSLRHVTFPRVHVECDFSAEIRFDDLAVIEVSVERVGRSSFTLLFDTIVNARSAAKGKITIVCVVRETQKPCAIPDEFAAKLRGRIPTD